ncbi:MAG: SpoIIE family protein phosphatase [Bacteroidales bacterium]|nr:MAG: SpoIIE family protein phosphatase [Bacteroidales bacterium]
MSNFFKEITKSSIYILLTGLISCFSAAQDYKFNSYGVKEGVCHPFVYTINQDLNGYIWIGTGEGLCRFDGFEFSKEIVADELIRDVASTSYKDSKGNLWFGFNNGNVCKFDGINFEIISATDERKSAVTDIIEIDGKILLIATLNDGLMVIGENKEIKLYDGELENKFIYSLNYSNGKLLLGSQEGLLVYDFEDNLNPPQFRFAIDELAYSKVQVIKKCSNYEGFWLGTESDGLFYLALDNDSDTLIKVGETLNISDINIQSIIEDLDNNLWLSTFRSGVFKLENPETEFNFKRVINYNKNNGLSSNFTKDVFEDREGNIWIATYGEGLATLLNEAFEFFSYPAEGINNNILSVCAGKNVMWFGGESALLQLKYTQDFETKIFNRSKGLPDDAVTALYFDGKSTLWIGTNSSGLFRMNTNTERITRYLYQANSLGRSVNSVTGSDESIYLATKDGIYYFNLKHDSTIHYTTIQGLPHNDIAKVFLDAENRLLFVTKSNGIYEINYKGEISGLYTVGNVELDFNSVAQDSYGNIWASTYGTGIFRFNHDTVINITDKDGLQSNYCYSIISSDSTYAWVGQRLGISRINIKSNAVYVYDVDKGINGNCNLNATCKDEAGVLYFGTTQGIVKYDKEKDRKNIVPPRTNITKVIISDKEYDFNKDIMLPYSAYKLRIEFTGLNYRDPEAVKYQYILEGYDLEWSEITDSKYVIYPRVEDGEYKFLLRSFNNDGFSEEVPASFKLKVKLPVWKTAWFISLVILLLILTVYLIIKIRERRQKQLQDYLEKSLAERTKEVVEQKEEIEIKNRDITDSINYAQRIQESILPPIRKLQENFSGSFVYYQPRDIVSGDFYWFDKISDRKFVIVCADSTGHGVPGAFMSMIGTTLIKDICLREGDKPPSSILRSLDIELRNTLNQNIEVGKPNDGMDIVVCEIDLKTNYLRYASAMRPMIVVKDGEQIYIKGSRSSVGGHYEKADKIFEDQGLQLSKGDIIYMFSDGYPDQFGGSIGKKFKMVRLKNLLTDIYQKTMDEQYNYVKSTFNLWKENYPQVDDVLFMGIRL